MALNMDDLIGSMQHGFHAGDRGNDLNEIRESLKLSLGSQQPHLSHTAAGPSNPVRRHPFAPPTSGATAAGAAAGGAGVAAQQGGWDARPSSSLDADVAMLSSSSSSSTQFQPHHLQPYQQQYWPQPSNTFFGAGGGGPGSWGSQSSASSSNFGAPMGGCGFAPAPANTPQQTPVETSELARQLQAELERSSTVASSSSSPPPGSGYSVHSAPFNAPLSPTLNNDPASPNALHAVAPHSPRSYVNGFTTTPTRQDSATPGPTANTPNPTIDRPLSLSPRSPDTPVNLPQFASSHRRDP